MQLTVSEPVFLWIFGIIAALIAILLALCVVAFVYIILMLRLSHRKARELGGTLDVVQDSIRETTLAFNDARSHLVQFFNQSLSAVGVANLVGAVRTAWGDVRQRSRRTAKHTPTSRATGKRSSRKKS